MAETNKEAIDVINKANGTVVADEIRQLSDSTKSVLGEIFSLSSQL